MTAIPTLPNGNPATLRAEIERLRVALQTIVDVYAMRGELFTSDDEVAESLRDRAVLALKENP